MEKVDLSWNDIGIRAQAIADKIEVNAVNMNPPLRLYGIPRGGVYAAQAVLSYIEKESELVEEPDDNCIFIDDIIDTGKTRDDFIEAYECPFLALVDKRGADRNVKGVWVSFPWERMTHDEGPVENVKRLLQYIGEDPERDGLKETPQRVIDSYKKLFGGYKQKMELKVFEDPCNQMVLLKNIEFYSTCEHHMLPFCGKAHIAYIPNGKIIGISKLVRVLEIFSRRLQIQERLCHQVTESLERMLKPSGTACVLEAQHLCMLCRGVEKQSSIMVTSSLTGVFESNLSTRNEFMRLIK